MGQLPADINVSDVVILAPVFCDFDSVSQVTEVLANSLDLWRQAGIIVPARQCESPAATLNSYGCNPHPLLIIAAYLLQHLLDHRAHRIRRLLCDLAALLHFSFLLYRFHAQVFLSSKLGDTSCFVSAHGSDLLSVTTASVTEREKFEPGESLLSKALQDRKHPIG